MSSMTKFVCQVNSITLITFSVKTCCLRSVCVKSSFI